MSARFLASTLVLLALLPACEKGTIEQPPTTPWDLRGYWMVYFVRHDDVVIDSTGVDVYQHEANVFFVEGIDGVPPDTVATGCISADTIMCSDMYNVGISKIFIDHDHHMHSETPALENLKYLEFAR